MYNLDELKQQTNNALSAFDAGEKGVPVPPQIYHDRLQAAREANLSTQIDIILFEMRCWQVEQLGFKSITISEAVALLKGEPATKAINDENAVAPAIAVYNHHTDNEMINWRHRPFTFIREERAGLWHLPPFESLVKWSVKTGPLYLLNQAIPYGVMLRLNECKNSKLFNSFIAVAPKSAWKASVKPIDPIIIASVYELPRNSDGTITSAGRCKDYFLAQW